MHALSDPMIPPTRAGDCASAALSLALLNADSDLAWACERTVLVSGLSLVVSGEKNWKETTGVGPSPMGKAKAEPRRSRVACMRALELGTKKEKHHARGIARA